MGDGWFGFTQDGVGEKLGKIKEYARAAGRDPDKLSFSISPGVGYPITMDDVKRLHDLGVQQVIVGGISTDPAAVKGDIEKLAEEFVVPGASL
jgi:alkanesulfonate monooxygenase SsuD/methylene tetrahydromethanopterin reductase-like flavin-dependent oxidoreductase (luciferase family)